MQGKVCGKKRHTKTEIRSEISELICGRIAAGENYNLTRDTVAAVVKTFAESGIDAVLARKRSVNSDQARRKVDGRTEARLIEVACSPAPEGHSRWTIRLLEDEMKIILDEPISREAIRRTLKKTGLDLTAVTTGVSQT